ncbi:Beta-hexosaminidase 3 [Orobanche minor]
MGRTWLAKATFLWFLVYIPVIRANAVDSEHLNIWPMPSSVTSGHGSLYLSNDFELKIEGSKFLDGSGILKDAFLRSIDLIRATHVIEANNSKIDPLLVLKGIRVLVVWPSDELQHGINESYKLQIPDPNNPLYAHIKAQTVYGALHGLQTFSQVCHYNISTRGILVQQVPLTIVDQPRFSYRGLLIDTSRHYQPLPVIKKVIDSMTYAKLNVLHWHIVDSQSFPLEIPSYPRLWEAAYSVYERYTFADAAEIVSYAKRRGINVLAEIDVPGHAQSWGVGYPSIWPSTDCKEPLDVSNEFTFTLIDGILSDFSKIFKYKFVHLGGDEVNTSCWESTPHVRNWLQENGLNGSEAYQYFVLRAQKMALSHGYEIINWEETFNNFGSNLSRKTVVHNWLGSGVAQRVVEAGMRCIVSNQDKWYLDHLDALWQDFYSNEPLTNITDANQQALVLGGEVCMWGEHADASDIEQTIWPRAAAAAERLWTPYENLATDPEQVKDRLSYFRCLLNQRGVAAALLDGFGRAAPHGPGSCYMQ